jgi:hypothetical protein
MAAKIASRRPSNRSCVQDNRSPDLARKARPWAEAILLSATLSLLFVFIYGGCNALAARRPDSGVCFFAWELRIPFVPAFIVPYLSIDLFFVISPLLCGDVIELRAYARRVTAAIIVAGLAFLLFPLSTGYPRPEVNGWPGWLFELLWSFDRPHNLVPSLHIALTSLLWPVYARHTGGLLKGFLHIWFTLILVSPLFTWQHHVLDLATGAMLGQVCLFAFPEKREPSLVQSSTANLRVAWLYATGSVMLGGLSIMFGSWFWLLLWPAASLTLISIAYVRGNSALFRKANGGLPVSTRIVLGPYLCGTFVRRLIYRRSNKLWNQVTPGVYCGGVLTNGQAMTLRALGITGVLDMTAEHGETQVFRDLDYLNVPVLDLTSPSQEQLDLCVAFIDEQVRRGGVYVHCALGISRSVTATAAYLAYRHMNLPDRSLG